MPVSFHIVTLGCKVNQYESQAIREALVRGGLVESEFLAGTDVVIINTCAVTSTSAGKCRRAVRRALFALGPSADPRRVIVTGCCVEICPEAFANLGVTMLPTARKAEIATLLSDSHPAAHSPNRPSDCADSAIRIPASETAGRPSPQSGLLDGRASQPAFRISSFSGHTRAFVKIQDGCDRFCAYCVVPFARGKPRSRPADEILNEVRALVAAGHREIVLTGICIGQYGRVGSVGSNALGDLMRRAGGIEGLKRLRLSSIEPNDVTDELLAAFAETPNFCPHLHVPLQSGDDGVLKSMNRRYTAAEFLATVAKLRAIFANPSITSDVIVGFPTEGRAAFENTMNICRQAGFSKIHIFPYSDRPGTAASGLKRRCHSREVSERFEELSKLELELALNYKRGFIGKRLEVLVESKREGPSQKLAGYTERYLKVVFDGPDELKGQFAQVEALSATPRRIEGKLASA